MMTLKEHNEMELLKEEVIELKEQNAVLVGRLKEMEAELKRYREEDPPAILDCGRAPSYKNLIVERDFDQKRFQAQKIMEGPTKGKCFILSTGETFFDEATMLNAGYKII